MWAMRTIPTALHGAFLRPLPTATLLRFRSRRPLLTLAIETSCDDTSVAVLEATEHRESGHTAAQLHFHEKVTADSLSFNGVHPLVAMESHQENLAKLVADAIDHLPKSASAEKRLPDFVAVTRGPGMRSSLFTGLDTAKGLAVAWQKPLLGIHHMHAHALTPRLDAALSVRKLAEDNKEDLDDGFAKDFASIKVDSGHEFPFLSVLVSGGHTLIVHSTSLTDHEIMASTTDIAIGECMDKVARVVLPPDVLQEAENTMYGALLEKFAFPSGNAEEYNYQVPKNNQEAFMRNITPWGWGLHQPLSWSGGNKMKAMEMSFTGLTTAVENNIRYHRGPVTKKLTSVERSPDRIDIDERQLMAHHAMRAAFEHVAERLWLALKKRPVSSVVLSGGVAANRYLTHILSSTLHARGFGNVKVIVPDPSLCCDNAAMIAWAGIEMFKNGARDCLDIRAIRKWPLDQLLSPPLEKTSLDPPPLEKTPLDSQPPENAPLDSPPLENAPLDSPPFEKTSPDLPPTEEIYLDSTPKESSP